MKYLIIVTIAAVSLGNEITKIAKVNSLKKEAKEAYLNGDYDIAIEKYKYLVDSFNVSEEEVILNLSNSFYNAKDTAEAFDYYQRLTRSEHPDLRSRAHQQLGVIEAGRKQYEQALASFKESLKSDPGNEESRYNYELLKKIIQDQKQKQQDQKNQNKDQQNKDQQNKDQQNQDKKDQEKKDQDQEKNDQQDQKNQQDQKKDEQQQQSEQEKEDQKKQQQEQNSTPEKLKEMNISEEKARMILEAMKNNEIQYIQQNKRKATQPKKTGKPDW